MSTKVSLAALALLIWRVINAETARLMKPEPGPGITEPYAARWGTQTHGRKTPYGAQKKTVRACAADGESGADFYGGCRFIRAWV